jgi:hypothetical protein
MVHSKERVVKLQHYGYEQISRCKKNIAETRNAEVQLNAAIQRYNDAKRTLSKLALTVTNLRTHEWRNWIQRDRLINRFGHPDNITYRAPSVGDIEDAYPILPWLAGRIELHNTKIKEHSNERKSPKKKHKAKAFEF